MRFLLLAALLFRMVPAPAVVAAEAHCVEGHAAGAEQGAHAHHDATPNGSHDECPHCPPADCAQHDHCPQPGLVLVAALAVSLSPAGHQVAPTTLRPDAFASRAPAPPVRPPLLPLA